MCINTLLKYFFRRIRMNFMETSFGDWGLGIGPIPNPQSPIPKIKIIIIKNE